MTWLEGLVLGFLQGATEFLPVSSSGHLVIGQAVLGIEVPGLSFEVALHVATLASVLFVYRTRILALVRGVLLREGESVRYAGLLLVASVPAAVAGIGFGAAFESLFESPAVTGVALIVTGAILWTAKAALARGPTESPGPATALIMGFAQAVAIVPGISRSGATVVAALWKGVDPEEAAAFSFLMSIPAIGGAAVLKLPELSQAGAEGFPAALALGAVVACVTGVLAIRTFVAMLRQRSFHRFAPYVWAVGALFLLYVRVT